MSVNKIETPRGIVFVTQNGKAKLEWNPDFSDKWTKRYSLAQKYVDREVLRLSNLKIPVQTHMLFQSGELGTIPGRGTVEWIAPYAKTQYYETPTTRSYDPQRGAYWFERMKAEHKESIIAGAKRRAGGKE